MTDSQRGLLLRLRVSLQEGENRCNFIYMKDRFGGSIQLSLLSFGSTSVCRKLCIWTLSTQEVNCNIMSCLSKTTFLYSALQSQDWNSGNEISAGFLLDSSKQGQSKETRRLEEEKGHPCLFLLAVSASTTQQWQQLLCFGLLSKSAPGATSDAWMAETWVSAPQRPPSKLLFSDHLTHSLLCLALDVVAAPRQFWLGVISVSPFCFVSSLTPGQPIFYIKIFSVKTTNIVSVSHLDPHRY